MNKNTLKSLVFNISVFLILMVVTFWFVFRDQDVSEIISVAQSANPLFILVGVACMLLYFAMEARNVKSILNSFGEKISFWKAYKFTLIGFFFCGVTPSASGGQPIEVYYMTKEGISGAHGALALLIQVCGVQIAVMALGIIGMLLNLELLTGPVLWLSLIGLVINGIALIILLVCIFSKKLTRKIANAGLSLMKKFGLKDIDERRKKLNASLDQYAEGAKYMKTHRKEFWLAMARVFLQFCFYFSIPFCVYKAFGLSGMNFIQVFALQAVLFMATSALPLPGAIGASESVFLSLFSMVFGAELLSSAMLLNRGISFYGFIIITLIVVFFNAIRVRNLKQTQKKK